MGSKRSHSLTSAEIIAGNDDLLIETILIHLPAKSLIQFQLVSKHWQSIISGSSFLRRHAHGRRLKSQHSYILWIRPDLARFFYFSSISGAFNSFHFDSPYTKILQSCNGLLLLETKYSPYGKKCYSVYNHTLNQSVEVKIERHQEYVAGVFLAFDPSTSVHFKVVCVCYPNYDVRVYDSGSKKWTGFSAPFPSLAVNYKLMNAIIWNNKIYWFNNPAVFYYFDLQTGVVGTVPLIQTPHIRRGEAYQEYFVESNGRVHCISIYLKPKVRSLFVFELMDDNSGWTEVCRVDVNSISNAYPDLNRQVTSGRIGVMGFVRGDTIEESTALFHVPGKAICFKFSDGSFDEVVLDLGTNDRFDFWSGCMAVLHPSFDAFRRDKERKKTTFRLGI